MVHPQSGFPDPQLIGQFRTFGALGPAYRVLEPLKQADNGEWFVRIQVLETGEETECPYAKPINDPEADS